MSRPHLPRAAKNKPMVPKCGSADRAMAEYSAAQKQMLSAKDVIPISEVEGCQDFVDSLLLVHKHDTKTIETIQKRISEFKYGCSSFSSTLEHQPLRPSEDIVWEAAACVIKQQRPNPDVFEVYTAGALGVDCDCCSSCWSQVDSKAPRVRICGASCACVTARTECFHSDCCCNTAIRDGKFPALTLCQQSYQSDRLVQDIGVRALERIPKGSVVCVWASRIYNRNSNSKQHSTYALEIGIPGCNSDVFMCEVIPHGNVAQFVNDPGPDKHLLNVEFVVYKALNDVYPAIVATKDIEENSFVYISYGESYFDQWDIQPLAPTNEQDKLFVTKYTIVDAQKVVDAQDSQTILGKHQIGSDFATLQIASEHGADRHVSLDRATRVNSNIEISKTQKSSVHLTPGEKIFRAKHFVGTQFIPQSSIEALQLTKTEWNDLITKEAAGLEGWPYASKEPVVVILQTWNKFKSDLLASHPKQRNELVLELNGNTGTNSLPEHLTFFSLFPKPVNVMTAVWDEEGKIYQPYISHNVFVVVGWTEDGQDDSIKSLVPVYLVCQISPLPNEQLSNQWLSKNSVMHQQCRMRRALEREQWSQSEAYCKMVPVPPLSFHQLTDSVPPPPQLFLLLPISKRTPVIDNVHEFRWTSSLDALEMGKLPDGSDTYEYLSRLGYDEWKNKIINIVGGKEYGNVAMVHLILMPMSTIVDDLKQHSSRNKLTEEEVEKLVWLEQQYPVATLAWDVAVDAYRVHLKKNAYILLKCNKNEDGLLCNPESIKFLSQVKYPFQANAGDDYVKCVVKNFDMEQEQWRLKTRYLN